jgi:hypothetical protein
MTHDLSSIYRYVEYGRYREMIWSQNRNMMFRAKVYVYNYMESQRLLYCRQIPKSYQNEQRLFCDKSTYSLRTSDLSRGRAPIKNGLWFISTIALFTQVEFQQIGLKNTVFSECHTHRIHLIWPRVIYTCFLHSKKNSNGFSWLTRTSFLSACKRF